MLHLASDQWQKGKESVQNGAIVIYESIVNALEEGKGCLIGRHGIIELTCVLLRESNNNLDSEHLRILERNAGVFPKTEFESWAKEYRDAAAEADVMAAAWYKPLAKSELTYLNSIAAEDQQRIPLRSLEPYHCPAPFWTAALSGQTVAVVSSFADSMMEQIQWIPEVWPRHSGILPEDVNWTFVRSYYSPPLAKGCCDWPPPIASWRDAVESLESQVVESGARICLIGCGGLAMPLAARLKKRGIVAIVLGGAIQILFGIRGRRWDAHPVISDFFNNHWVYPSADEVPGCSESVEGGCYW